MVAPRGMPRTTDHKVEFPYTRTLGPVIGAFLTGLRDQRVLGIRAGDQVLVPALEYDPATGDALDPESMIAVAPAGTVTSWTWVGAPTPHHPLDRPFAFAMVRLDGADTAMVHAVDVAGPSDMRTGMRVRIRWRGERSGSIKDIECFEPEEAT